MIGALAALALAGASAAQVDLQDNYPSAMSRGVDGLISSRPPRS